MRPSCFYRALLHACGADCMCFAAADKSFVAMQGTCKSFDASANGYARADGIAIVVLRKAGLKEQIGTWAARQPYAQVLACATNNDGHTKEGITFPSGPAQKALAQEVHSCTISLHHASCCLPVSCHARHAVFYSLWQSASANREAAGGACMQILNGGHQRMFSMTSSAVNKYPVLCRCAPRQAWSHQPSPTSRRTARAQWPATGRSWARWRSGTAAPAHARLRTRCSLALSSPTWATARAAPAWLVRLLSSSTLCAFCCLC